MRGKEVCEATHFGIEMEGLHVWRVWVDRGSAIIKTLVVTNSGMLAEVHNLINETYGNDEIVKLVHVGAAMCWPGATKASGRSTKALVEELETREGVESYWVDVEGRYKLDIDNGAEGGGQEDIGPARILIVTD